MKHVCLALLLSTFATTTYAKYEAISAEDRDTYFHAIRPNCDSGTIADIAEDLREKKSIAQYGQTGIDVQKFLDRMSEYKEIADKFETFANSPQGAHFFANPHLNNLLIEAKKTNALKNEKSANQIFEKLCGAYYVYLISSRGDSDAEKMAGYFEKILDSILTGKIFKLSQKVGNAKHRGIITDYLLRKRLNRLMNGETEEPNSSYDNKQLPAQYKGDIYTNHMGLLRAVTNVSAKVFRTGHDLQDMIDSEKIEPEPKKKLNSDDFKKRMSDFIKTNSETIKVAAYVSQPSTLEAEFQTDIFAYANPIDPLTGDHTDKNYDIKKDFRFHAFEMLMEFYKQRKNYLNKPGGVSVTVNAWNGGINVDWGNINETVKSALNTKHYGKGHNINLFDWTTQFLEGPEYVGLQQSSIQDLNQRHFKSRMDYKNVGYGAAIPQYMTQALQTNPQMLEELRIILAEKCRYAIENITRDFVKSYVFFKKLGLETKLLSEIRNNGCVNARIGDPAKLYGTFFNEYLYERNAEGGVLSSFPQMLFTSFIEKFKNSAEEKEKTWKAAKEFIKQYFEIGIANGQIKNFYYDINDKEKFKKADLKDLEDKIKNDYYLMHYEHIENDNTIFIRTN